MRPLQDHAPLLAIAIGTAFFAAVLAISLTPSGRNASAGGFATVEVRSNKYCDPGESNCGSAGSPHEVEIIPGGNVQWDWLGGTHSVTSCGNGFTSCDGSTFDSGVQGTGSAFGFSFPATDATYYYQCSVHGSSMRGIVTVGTPETPTPTPSLSPTPSPTPTPSPEPTPLPTFSSNRADMDCDGDVDGTDVIALLQYAAGEAGAGTAGACPPIGADNGDNLKGDLNCDGLIDGRDALIALLVWAELPVEGFLPEGCPVP